MIQATDIHKKFDTLEVLKGVSLQVQKGEIVAIVGKSGAGKTTLLQILGTLDKADKGKVIINGTDVSTLGERQLAQFRNRHIGFIFQFHQLLPEFTALENIMMPALIAGRSKKEASTEASQLLTQLGLADRADHKPSELSGGEKQRVAAARALINHPDVILADEPTGSLDSANKQEIGQLLQQLRNDYQQTIILVTHDADLAAIADRIIEMQDGQILTATETNQAENTPDEII